MAATIRTTTLVTVESLRQTDWPTPSDIITLMLATGTRLEWRANPRDMAIAQMVTPFQEGSILTLTASRTADGRLRNVRYVCEGKEFHGATAHLKALSA